MLGGYIGEGCQRILNGIVRQIARLDPNPNLISVIGLGINIFAALLYGYGLFFYAGLVMIFANIFDMLDGQVARLTGRVTKLEPFSIRVSIGFPTWSSFSESLSSIL